MSRRPPWAAARPNPVSRRSFIDTAKGPDGAEAASRWEFWGIACAEVGMARGGETLHSLLGRRRTRAMRSVGTKCRSSDWSALRQGPTLPNNSLTRWRISHAGLHTNVYHSELQQMNMLRILVLLATAVALSGCGSTTGSRAGSAAVFGAASGAAIGSLSGNAGRGALIGAGAGAVGGFLYDQHRRGNID
jgi:hypothetical protein